MITKFERELMKTNEDIASQSRKILQTFVWGVGGGGVGSPIWPPPPPPPPPPPQKLPPPPPHHTNVCKFSQLYGAIASPT